MASTRYRRLSVEDIITAGTYLQTKLVRSANAGQLQAGRAEEKSIACLGRSEAQSDFVIACIRHLLFSRCSSDWPEQRQVAGFGQRQHCDVGSWVKWFVRLCTVNSKSVVELWPCRNQSVTPTPMLKPRSYLFCHYHRNRHAALYMYAVSH